MSADTRTSREVAEELFEDDASQALIAAIRDDEPEARRLVLGMYPYRRDELAQAAQRLMEIAEGELLPAGNEED